MYRSNNNQLQRRVAELERQMRNVVISGRVTEVDHEACKAKVKYGEYETGFLPWLCCRAGNGIAYWSPSKDEAVTVFCQEGQLEFGVIMGSLYQKTHRSKISEDRFPKLIFNNGSEIRVTDEGIQLKGNIVINGELKAVSVEDQDGSLEQQRQDHETHIKEYKKHVHSSNMTVPM